MVGRNVIVNGGGGGEPKDEESNSTSLSSSSPGAVAMATADTTGKILCKVSVAPIISSATSGMFGNEPEAEQSKAKRMRTSSSSSSSSSGQYVSHFVIQFEPKEQHGGESEESISSASMSAAAQHGMGAVLQPAGSASESSQALQAVA